MPAVLNEALFTRALLRARGKRTPKRKLPRQLWPSAVAAAYYSELKILLKEMKLAVDAHVLPRLERWVRERNDAMSDELNPLVDEISDTVFERFSNERLRVLSEKYGKRTSDFQREQLQKQFRATLGVDVVAAEPWLAGEIARFTAENVGLIKSLPAKYFSEIESLVIREVRAGERAETIAARMQERYAISEDRAKLIARDQVGKMTGFLNERRQTDLGITHFIWQTSQDERVREEHQALQGKRFSWAEGAPEEGIPGEPVMCRCYAEADLSGILADL